MPNPEAEELLDRLIENTQTDPDGGAWWYDADESLALLNAYTAKVLEDAACLACHSCDSGYPFDDDEKQYHGGLVPGLGRIKTHHCKATRIRARAAEMKGTE